MEINLQSSIYINSIALSQRDDHLQQHRFKVIILNTLYLLKVLLAYFHVPSIALSSCFGFSSVSLHVFLLFLLVPYSHNKKE